MNCPLESRENAQLLLNYCAGKLEPVAAAALERHIAACSPCRAFTGKQEAVWAALDAWEAPPVSRDFDSRLYRRIDREVSWWNGLLQGVSAFRHLSLRRSLPALAMVCVMMTAGLLLDHSAVSPAPLAPSDITQVDSVQPEQVVHALDQMEMLNEFSIHVWPDGAESKL